jgi:hypothetical protein
MRPVDKTFTAGVRGENIDGFRLATIFTTVVVVIVVLSTMILPLKSWERFPRSTIKAWLPSRPRKAKSFKCTWQG